MLEQFYSTKELKKLFKDGDFVGPDVMPHAEEVLIARLIKGEKSDGHDVEVYATFMPADFYRIKALDSKDTINQEQKGFELSTGSSMAKWAASTAYHIVEGMVGA